MSRSVFISNIFIHVAVMSLFLTIFFFTIAANQEKNIVEKQINFIVDEFIGNILFPLDNSLKEYIKRKINSKLEDAKNDLKDQDKKVNVQNNKIIKKAFTFALIFLIIVIFIVGITSFYYKWPSHYIYYLIYSNIITLIFVAITETAFLFLIAKEYYSVDPNKIKLKILDKLLE